MLNQTIRLALPLSLLLASACNQSDERLPADAAPGAPDSALVVFDAIPTFDATTGDPIELTSPVLTDGEAMPLLHACTSLGGANQSPSLAWTEFVGAQSYAMVLVDMDNNLTHSAIYDIPSTVFELPADIEAGYEPADVPGAHQAKNYSGALSYAGPCPPSEHTYVFNLIALDVATLPGMSATSTAGEVKTAVAGHELARGTLSVTFDPP